MKNNFGKHSKICSKVSVGIVSSFMFLGFVGHKDANAMFGNVRKLIARFNNIPGGLTGTVKLATTGGKGSPTKLAITGGPKKISPKVYKTEIKANVDDYRPSSDPKKSGARYLSYLAAKISGKGLPVSKRKVYKIGGSTDIESKKSISTGADGKFIAQRIWVDDNIDGYKPKKYHTTRVSDVLGKDGDPVGEYLVRNRSITEDERRQIGDLNRKALQKR